MNQNYTHRHHKMGYGMANKFSYTYTYTHMQSFQYIRKLPYGHMPFINKTMSTATRHINIYLYLLHGSHRYSLCAVGALFFCCRCCSKDAAKSILLVGCCRFIAILPSCALVLLSPNKFFGTKKFCTRHEFLNQHFRLLNFIDCRDVVFYCFIWGLVFFSPSCHLCYISN